MLLCVIPARGGSKRIPRKNARPFCGVPLVQRAIGIALSAELFDDVVVSTDDPQIAELAAAAGAAVPFVRRADLADDYAPTNVVVADAVERIQELGEQISLVCCLYATAPFVTAEDLRRGLEVYAAGPAEFAFAATTFAFPVHRALLIGGDGFVAPLFPEHIRSRSQDLPEAVHDAGQFYWGSPEAFARRVTVLEGRAKPVLIPRSRVQDIDTPEDWDRAEVMYRVLHEERAAMGRLFPDNEGRSQHVD